MKRALLRVYVSFSFLIILAITAYFFYGMYSIRQETREQTATAFRDLSNVAASLWNENEVDRAGTLLSQAIAEMESIAPLFFSVYRLEDGIDYLWTVDDRFLVSVDGTRSEPVARSNQILHSRYSRSFQVSDGQRRIVTAVYPAIPGADAYPVLREVLIAFVVLVGFSLVVALASILSRRAPRTVPLADGPSSEPKPPVATAVHDRRAQRDETTGLNPESVLERRIGLELERAGYHEQDLSVALFEFNSGKRATEQRHLNAQAILSFFTFEDLCFEFGRTGIVVVFPNTSLGETLKQIERFQQYYWNERTSWENREADFLCGVSARNGRLVEGTRVIGECKIALKRASSTSGRIVGFKPDPDKYREYLSSK